MVLRLLCAVAIVVLLGGCGRGEDSGGGGRPADVDAKRADVLVFPDALKVEDASVNEFVTRAMRICGLGDYNAFRLLWSVRDDPLPRGEFEEGWDAVQTIRVEELRKVMLAGDSAGDVAAARTTGGVVAGLESVYVMVAGVEFDPTHRIGRSEPQREVILMLVREHDAWKLAQPPKKMRLWARRELERRRSDAKESAAAALSDPSSVNAGRPATQQANP
ncbi:MAG: hypothetical protein IID35_11425 [Planctomycetes bacterium]|nr:hypothetical protein [Planctomycetota bacterium]